MKIKAVYFIEGERRDPLTGELEPSEFYYYYAWDVVNRTDENIDPW